MSNKSKSFDIFSFYYLVLIIGLILIVAISLAQGFEESFIGAILHIQSDLSDEIIVHLYITGWVLVLYGFYRILRNRK